MAPSASRNAPAARPHAGARDEGHDAPEDGRTPVSLHRRVAHVVGAAAISSPARRPEHLQGRHPLQPVDELRGERPVARPELHVRLRARGTRPAMATSAARTVRPARRRPSTIRDHGDRPRPPRCPRRSPSTGTAGSTRRGAPRRRARPPAAASLARHPGGAESKDPVDQPATEVGRSGPRRRPSCLDRGAHRPNPTRATARTSGGTTSVIGAPSKTRPRPPARPPWRPSGGHAEPERHRSGEGGLLGRRQPHQPRVEGARGAGYRPWRHLSVGKSSFPFRLTMRRQGLNTAAMTDGLPVNAVAEMK